MKRVANQFYDRVYLEMNFPPIVMDLLDCPGLLRLRDVRMANNQFCAFPAFANSSRYEHSLGVCYLAGICADHLGLFEKDKLELMIAGLYHDVGTPPFAHAMEEVLQAEFGFDHEENLKSLITGDTGEFDQDYAQVYLGQSLKLKSVCQSKKARKLGIDPHRIAKIAVGDSTDELSPLICGSGMDLDNIDNICRAVSAMGILHEKIDYSALAKKLAFSFVLAKGNVYYDRKHAEEIGQWLKMRDIQYTEIFRSIDDFSYQAMIKKAIRLLREREGEIGLSRNIWRMTDSEFTYQYLLQHSKSRPLMERVLLCKPYPPLAILYVRGEGAKNYINHHIRMIEEEVSRYLSEAIGISRFAGQDLVLANYYPDKRHRELPEERWLGEGNTKHEERLTEGAILGLFTPAKVVGYATDSDNRRSLRRFDKKNIPGLIQEVQRLLKGFEVMEYGDENRGRNKASYGKDQLGL